MNESKALRIDIKTASIDDTSYFLRDPSETPDSKEVSWKSWKTYIANAHPIKHAAVKKNPWIYLFTFSPDE